MTQPSPKHRFAALDGLRAVAAAGVLLYHVAEWSGRPGWFAHGYLAVDFFFCLSGFVISHAFEQRPIGWPTYLWIRVVRIWPLLVLGTLAGAALTWRSSPPFGPNLVRGLLLVPRLEPAAYATFPPLFPFNPPAWSLCLEVTVSVLWFPLRRLPTTVLATIAIAALSVMVWAAWGMGGIETGWDRATFWIGLARAAFSFCLGWACRRHGARVPKAPLWLAAPVMLAVLCVPILPAANAYYDFACAGLLFPILVLTGAHDPDGVTGVVCREAGEVSYPLYALHWVVWAALLRLIPAGVQPLAPLWFCALGLVAAPAVAWAALRVYDRPVRAWLGRRRTKAAV